MDINLVSLIKIGEINMDISIIIPVFNRPTEVSALLESLYLQSDQAFEVVIVEDGSTIRCETEVNAYGGKLNLNYIYKENSGPGHSRNVGCENASGDYFLFLDSDCVLPTQYVAVVKKKLAEEYTDAFGGPDQAREDFSPIQRAINYSMTSFLTTGGIRGGSEKLDKFHPRSFNMGYSSEVFEKTGGFSLMRFGEDIDMSIRIINSGFRTQLIKEAYVYHKRRTNLRRFFKQVYNSGVARINLYIRHPHSLKLVHLAPAVFTIGVFLLLVLFFIASPYFFLPLLFHMSFILIDATMKSKSLFVGILSVITSYVQLLGYGIGFLYAFIWRIVLRKAEFAAFQKSFYK
ncbi:glycosyltransferase [Parapedobacter tibetensis]|uniref:glycosyltransferase n=1 Tax=Parapedobacter tibetensis TaxID=2972951 RepID=UPI00214DE72D|nr:glycosyltransferase [Parapedobacter tibetensis]